MSDNAPSATQEMTRLIEQRERAREHVDGLEAEWRASTERAAAASDALTQFERHPGGKATERKKLEVELAEAREVASQPWAERVAGGRQAVADAHAAVMQYARVNLDALVGALESEGEAVAAKLTATASTLVELYPATS